MRAAFLVADILLDADIAPILAELEAAGLRPVVLKLAGSGWQAPSGVDVLTVASLGGRPDCWNENGGLLANAAARARVATSEAFLFCAAPADVTAAVDAACRPVLVLAGQTLDAVFGEVEPRYKGTCTAGDLAAAVRYAVEEAAQDAAIGPFPYGQTVPQEVRSRALAPSPRDLATLLALITLAGVAIALGIAYLLQEVYQRATLPAAAYWITLQFIPQALRGLLFLAFGGAVGMMVRPYLSRLSGRYRARRL